MQVPSGFKKSTCKLQKEKVKKFGFQAKNILQLPVQFKTL